MHEYCVKYISVWKCCEYTQCNAQGTCPTSTCALNAVTRKRIEEPHFIVDMLLCGQQCLVEYIIRNTTACMGQRCGGFWEWVDCIQEMELNMK